MSREYESLERESDQNDNFKVQSVYNLMTKTDEEIIKELGCVKKLPDEETAQGMNDETRKTLSQRLFSKMEAGSLRGSIFAMSSIALGTGSLALPKVLEQLSLTIGALLIVIGSIIAYWSLITVIEASRKTGSTNYSSAVMDSLGPKPALFLDMAVLLYIFGVLISYQVLSKILIRYIFKLINIYFNYHP